MVSERTKRLEEDNKSEQIENQSAFYNNVVPNVPYAYNPELDYEAQPVARDSEKVS
jgi:hypothetical protein